MNRRSFFGFACGGVVAGPIALMGEREELAIIGDIGPVLPAHKLPLRSYNVPLIEAADTKRIGQMIQAGVDEALARYDARKGGNHAQRG